MKLVDLIEKVEDEKSFLTFVHALINDRKADEVNGTDSWQNDTIVDFLEAAHAWGSDTHMGEFQELGGKSPWKRFAVFLYCGKIYE